MTSLELLTTLAERSFSFAVLICIVLLIRKPVASKFGAHTAYALWLAPFGRLFLPELNILPAPTPQTSETFAAVVAAPQIGTIQQYAPSGPDMVGLAALFALFTWAIIAAGIIARLVIDHIQFMRNAMRASVPSPARVSDLAISIAEEFKTTIKPEQIRIARENIGPFIAGFTKPIIVLPRGFADTYTPREQRLALAHELCHLNRKDLLAQLIARLVVAAQWPNPLAHIALRAFQKDQEAACDVSVLNRYNDRHSATTYASALVKSATNNFQSNNALAMGGPLKERLMAIGNAKRTTSNKLMGSVFAAAFIATGLAATATYGQEEEKEVKKERVIIQTDSDGNVLTEKRIMVINGIEDEVIFDDVSVGGRTQVLEFEGDDGQKRVIRIKDGKKTVRVYNDEGELVTEDVTEIDGESSENVVVFAGESDANTFAFLSGDGKPTHFNAKCNADEGEPVLLEWKDESGDENNKRVEHTVICLTGEDADPEKRVEALRKAIDHIEESAKKEEERRKKMVKELKKQLREIEKEDG